MKRLVFILFASLSVLLGISQVYTHASLNSGIVAGRITDKSTHQPLIGATVRLDGTALSTTSGAGGNYTLSNVPAGTYTVRISCSGYKDVSIRGIAVKANDAVKVDAQLSVGANPLEALTEDRRDKKDVIKSGEYGTGIGSGSGRLGYGGGAAPAQSYPMRTETRPRTPYPTTTPYPRPKPHPPIDGEHPDANTEEYGKIVENEFLDVAQNPLSTFSIDVDAASYALVRRFLNQSQLPPKDAVRTEELINNFTYDYPQPTDGHPFSITTEAAVCPWKPEHKLVSIGLQGKKIQTDNLPATNLTFLIDVSGSMNTPERLPLVKSAFRLLVNQLRAKDRVAIVVYAGSAGLVLPSTSGNEKETILAAIDRLEAGGSTAGGAGIQLAYKTAKDNFIRGGNNRVILATDGDFNVGASSDGELVRIIEEKRKDGVFLTVLGFGMGNYKDSKMQQLANKGNGNHYYIDTIFEAKKVFVGQMAGTLFTIAKDVKLQLEFNPNKVQAYRLIGYENRLLAKEDFNDDLKDAGELGAGHTVTALYEVVPVGVKSPANSVDALKYQQTQPSRNAGGSELLTVKFRYKSPDEEKSKLLERVLQDKFVAIESASQNLRFSASVAEFGMLLFGSKHKSNATFDQTLALANGAKGADTEGYRTEFIRLIETAKTLAQPNTVGRD